MNKQNIQILIDHLKTQTHCGFNMGAYISQLHEPVLDRSPNHCGTTACLAGHIYHIVHHTDLKSESAFDVENEMFWEGQHFLDLSNHQASQLFLGINSSRDLDEITLEHAIRTLELLMETGEVIWDE